MRRLRRTSAKPCRRRERTVASSPQPIGDGTPIGGGGRCALKTWNILPMKPSGVQLAKAICPPGLVTRSSSAAARWGRGANITPNILADRKSTRLNSSHGYISYADFCLKKKTAMKLGRLLWKVGDGTIIDGVGPDGIAVRFLDATRGAVL